MQDVVNFLLIIFPIQYNYGITFVRFKDDDVCICFEDFQNFEDVLL